MKFKALAVAAALAASGSAFAAPIFADTFTVLPGQSVNFAGGFGGTDFSDTFTFLASGLGTVGLATFSFVPFAPTPITGFQATLNGTALTPLSAGGGTFLFGADVGTSFSLVVSGLSAGFYSGTFTSAVSAVPEPGSLALMLAGLGVVGFVGARRRKS